MAHLVIRRLMVPYARSCRTIWLQSRLPVVTCTSSQHVHQRLFHLNTNRLLSPDSEHENQLSVRQQTDIFEDVARRKKVKNAETFEMAVEKFRERNRTFRRHTEFVDAALDTMKDFGVDRDLTAYKQLISLFPKGKYVARNRLQAEFKHQPKQQDCMMKLLDAMTDKGVMPDTETGQMLVDIFGQRTHAFKKYQRMMYWMPKGRHANPYPVPNPMPSDPKQVAEATLNRMSVDVENEVTVFQTSEVEGHESGPEVFVASSQSPIQQELMSQLSVDTAVVVEGPFRAYIGREYQTYYVLRTDTTERYKRHQEAEQDEDDTKFQLASMFEEEEYTERPIPPSKHEQSDGTILAMCVPGSGSHRPALLAWIKWLEKQNPRLAQVPVLFQIESDLMDGGGQLQAYTGQAEKERTVEEKALKEIFKDTKTNSSTSR